jgi:long-chain acyl-CoA synthetase
MKIDWLESRTQITGKNVAVIEPDKNREWTFQEINQRAKNLAHYLELKGIQEGDRIAIYSENDIAHLDMFFAASKLGAIFIPLNWRLKQEEMRKILEDADPKFVAYSENMDYRIDFEYLNTFAHINTQGEKYNNIVDINQPKAFESVELDQEDIAILIYSSGTTGVPKGAMISHRAVISNGLLTIASWDLTSSDRTITLPPLFHTAGLLGTILPTLMAGGSIVFQPEFEATKTMDNIHTYQVTLAFMVPTMSYMLINSEEFDPEKLRSVKLVISGGAPIQDKVLKEFMNHKLPLINSFGMTEIGPNNFYLDPKIATEKLNSVGHPILFTDAKIVDSEMNEVEPGEIGELLLKNDSAFSGYWNNRDLTKETFHEGYVRTGDLAQTDEDGYYYIVGRKRDMIITGGENVFPGEVESVLDAHPSVKHSVVVGYPTEKWGESVAAAIVPSEDSQNDEDYEAILKEWSVSKLAGYKTPKVYLKLDSLPENSTGKIDKNKIQEMIIKKSNTL